jgi:hypothetical protein
MLPNKDAIEEIIEQQEFLIEEDNLIRRSH